MNKNNITLSLIVAMSTQGVIGKNNEMPWGRLPVDLAYFKEKTNGKPIIMGRKTYESIGRILPGRTNIIVSSNKKLFISGAFVVSSIEEAIEVAKLENPKEIFFIGGGKIYEEVLELVDKLYITKIDGKFEGDTFFPNYSLLNISLLKTTSSKIDSKNPYSCKFYEFERI